MASRSHKDGRKQQPSTERAAREGNVLEVEALLNQLEQLKKKFAAVRQDNVFLRTQVQRLSSQLSKKEKQVQHILAIKVAGISDKTGGDPAIHSRLQALKQEMVSITKLTARVRDLETEVSAKDEELKLIKSSMKFTLIKELQIEAQTYYSEARKMKKLLDQRPEKDPSARNKVATAPGDVLRGDPNELELLREEVSRLRRENTYLRGERDLEDQSYSMMARMRSKMEALQHEMGNIQEHMMNVDGLRTNNEALSQMVVQHAEDKDDYGPADVVAATYDNRSHHSASKPASVKGDHGSSQHDNGGGYDDFGFEDDADMPVQAHKSSSNSNLKTASKSHSNDEYDSLTASLQDDGYGDDDYFN